MSNLRIRRAALDSECKVDVRRLLLDSNQPEGTIRFMSTKRNRASSNADGGIARRHRSRTAESVGPVITYVLEVRP
jgi:hypothetical protein